MSSILIVDDSPDSRSLIKKMLNNGGYSDIKLAESAGEAFRLLGMEEPNRGDSDIDLILMDIIMPEVNGIEACYRIKAVDSLKDIPVVMVTSSAEKASLQMAFGAGAIDYIVKPVDKTELLARVRSVLKLKHEMDRRKAREQELLELTKQLESANRVLQSFSSLDGLTSIANRRFFDGFFDREWSRAKRYEHSLALILVDLDFFKLYNDTYGHHAGDSCLQRVAKALSEMERKPGDLVARFGGEEFAIVVSDVDAEEARDIAEKARECVENLRIPHSGSGISDVVTVSLGAVVAVPARESSTSRFIDFAEKALEQAKLEGRNKVVVLSTI